MPGVSKNAECQIPAAVKGGAKIRLLCNEDMYLFPWTAWLKVLAVRFPGSFYSVLRYYNIRYSASNNSDWNTIVGHTVPKWLNMAKPYPCQVCNKCFGTRKGAQAHTIDVHYLQCPECPRRFESQTARTSHQQTKKHFNCVRCQQPSTGNHVVPPATREVITTQRPQPVQQGESKPFSCKLCNRRFTDKPTLSSHERDAHSMNFRCCPCDREFVDENALRQHLEDKEHPEADTKLLPRCEECGKNFNSQTSLRQHKLSTIHRPLAKLGYVGKGCRLTFNSPSALLHHLESGHCPSGWSREKINLTLHKYDKERILTTNVISLDTTISNMTPSTSVSSLSDFVILTPSERSDTEDGEWGTFLETTMPSTSLATASTDSELTGELSCPLCVAKGIKRVFKSSTALDSHISSAAHAEKAFRCPTALTGGSDTPNPRLFNTLSGLTQHLESGQCRGGKSTLWKTLKYLQTDVLQLEWPGKLMES